MRMRQPALIFGLFLALFALTSCGVELGWPDYSEKGSEKADTAPRLRIFVTQATTDGQIGSGGIDQADSYCAQDANKPNSSVYKAMLVDGVNRVAAPGSQVGWVLVKERTYIRPDGTEIGRTSKDAIFLFPLKATIAADDTAVWTGINGGSWAAGLNCDKWADDASTRNGTFAQAKRTTVDAVLAGTDSCDTARHLYCVEQPALEDD